MADYYVYHQQVTQRRRRRRLLIAALLVLVLLAAGAGFYYYVADKDEAQPALAEPLAAETPAPTPAPTPEPAPTPAPERAGFAPKHLLPEVDNAAWDTAAPVAATIDQEYLNTDYRMVAVPALGTVERSTFDTTTFVGDSIMSGLGIYDAGLPNAKYVAYIGASANTFVNNVSMKNAVTKVEETPKEAILATQPDVLYIMCGTNSLQQLGTEEGLIAYYGRMLDEFREMLPGVPFYVQAIPNVQEYVRDGGGRQTARPGLYPERLETINNMLANLALSKGCYFININEVLSGPDGYMKDEYDANYDGIHFNPTGYRVWGEYLLTHTVWSPRNKYAGENPYYIYGK